MKLHLPCALRGALLACFALVCTVPAWAENDVTTEGSTSTINGIVESPLFIKASTDTEYTIKTSSPTGSAMLSTLNIISAEGATGVTKIIIDGATVTSTSPNASFVINNLAVEDGKELHIVIKSGTTVTLTNVNFTSKVTYEIESGGRLMISADDCAQKYNNHVPVITGSGSLVIFGGTIDATNSPSSTFADVDYDSGLGTQGFVDDMNTWLAPYLGEGAAINYEQVPGYPFYVNGPNGGGGRIYLDEKLSPCIDWKTNGAQKIVKDTASVIIDPETQVYRSGSAGNKVWNLHMDATVQQLQSGKLGDVNDAAYVKMGTDDGMSFQGGTLSSSANVTIGGIIEAVDETVDNGDGTTTVIEHKVILAPDAGTTMKFLQGDGALSSGNGLLLKGGDGSTVELWGVATSAPTGIEFATENTTLAIAGPDTLTLNAADNIFLATSHLSKLDGGTLTFVAQATDTIGSLSNEKGTVEIGSVTTLTVGTITAETLNLSKDGTALTATTLTLGNLKLTDWVNSAAGVKLETDTLTATDTVTLGTYGTVLADTAYLNNAKLAGGASITGDKITATGTVTLDGMGWVAAKVVAGNITAAAVKNTEATLTGMALSSDALTTSVVKNAAITTTDAAALTLGTVTGSTITAADGTTIANTTFEGTNTITSAGNLTLNGTTHGTGTTVSATSFTMSGAGATLLTSSSITADGTEYKVSDVPNSVTITGTADAAGMTISTLFVDLTGMPVPTTSTQNILTGGAAITEGSGLSFDYVTDPGMIPYLAWNGKELGFDLRDESDKILESLKTSENATAAADIIADYGMAAGTGTLAEVFNYLRDTSRADATKRQAALDALVSGSVTMLADSQRQGVQNTLNRLRNRIIQMGNPQGIELEKNVHAWISADGSSNDIDQDGACAGYQYQTWGGTVGVHADVGNFSFGAAISAAYGDLSSHATDRAEADHDTITLSGFVRHQSGRWTQMGILSLGRNVIDMNRSVSAEKNPGKGDSLSYDGDGDASGHTITGYYEAGYTFAINEEGSQVLQPMVSLSLTSARMGDYTETGSIGNAGVCTDTEDYFYGTVGIGARYQLVLGTTSHDRLSFLELRAKLVQDFGDETNETTAFFAAAPGQSFTVKGAEVGRTGFQLGAGVSVPMGEYTTLFADADADFRSGATSVGGSVGLRVEF